MKHYSVIKKNNNNKKRTPIRTSTTVKMEGTQPQPGEKMDFHQSDRSKLHSFPFVIKYSGVSFGNPFFCHWAWTKVYEENC